MKTATTKNEPVPAPAVREPAIRKTTYKASFRLFFLFVLLLLASAPIVRAQSALDGFDPNANGTVQIVVHQPDGKILIGGDFTTLAPNGGVSVTRNHIARLNHDGTLDTAFNPNADGTVYAIAVQTDGKILAGGFFTAIGGVARTNIARLDATTGLADSLNPNANSGVASIVVQIDGRILVGGAFTSIGGQMRNRIARLDAVTGLADSFNPNANNAILSIALQPDGKILLGGAFSGTNSIGGQTRNFIARVDSTSGAADSFDPNANGFIFSIALQANGKILAGGTFNGTNSIGGSPRNRIARLDPITGLADSFDPNASGQVNAILVQPDGRIVAGGTFSSIGGQTRSRIARLDDATGLADSFNPNASGVGLVAVYSLALQPNDGKILAGGEFATLTANGGAAVTRNRIVRLETDGRVDRTLDFTIGITDCCSVFATALQADGKILIAGSFNSVLGTLRNNIARLNSDGTLDAAFNPNVDGGIRSVVVQTDGKILVGGSFTAIGGLARTNIGRVDATTGLADSFSPNANSTIYSIAVQADGKILAGGQFTSIGGQSRSFLARLDATTGVADSFDANVGSDGFLSWVFAILIQADGRMLIAGDFKAIAGQTRNNIARLNADGTLDMAFDPNSKSIVNAIATQSDGKIVAGGYFNGTNSIGGQTRNFIARLDPTTGLADSFNPNANGIVNVIVLQSDGKIIAGGGFEGANSIGGAARSYIARLDPNTGLADSFSPDANNLVLSIALQSDGKVLVGGAFNGVNSIGGQTRNRFARLNNDTVARQDLSVSQTAVTWMRGGSSPQLTSVTFEDSTDNVSYNFLGYGTAVGSDWTLTNLNLSLGQNLYVRARAHYRGGMSGSSESVTESVRNAVLVPFEATQPFINIKRSANTDVVLSWATNFTGFTLEANTNLNTSIWSVVSPAPVISGTNNVVTNPISGSARFYRLRH